MNSDTPAELAAPSSSLLRNMLLAVIAPFLAIGLLASPLAVDALRTTLGF